MNRAPCFTADNGTLRFLVGEHELYRTDGAVGFLFDDDTGTLFKHGPMVLVEQTKEEYLQAYRRVGVTDMNLSILSFEPGQYDAALFTRFVDTPGVVKTWCECGASGTLLATA